MAKKKNSTKKTTRSKKGFLKGFKKYPLWKKILTVLLILFIIGLFCGLALYMTLAFNTIKITDSNFNQNSSSSLVYDNEGNQFGKLSLKDVKWVDYKDDEGNYNVSEYYINGLIATEDQSFWHNIGINFTGLFRAVFSAVLHGNTSGGGASSITMQLAKLLYLGPQKITDSNGIVMDWYDPGAQSTIYSYMIDYETPIIYKLVQMVLAIKIDWKYSKDEILNNYINTMYFGNGGYGIKNAANYFYDKEPKDLSIAESAMLAGMTQRPVDWNPYTNPEASKQRRDVVIKRLAAENYITKEERDKAIAEPIDATLKDQSDADQEEIESAAFNDFSLVVLDEIEKEFGGKVDPSLGGMKIYTTMDRDLQIRTYEVLRSDKYVNYLDEQQAATTSIDTQTGAVLAIGNGTSTSQYNFATKDKRSPGSSAKPIAAYGPAIEFLKWSSAHPLDDSETSYSDGTKIKNFHSGYQGPVTMAYALAQSLNTTAVQANQAANKGVGAYRVEQWIKDLGIEIDPAVPYNEAFALGGFDATTLQMAAAYSAFANGGTYHEPYIIDHIEFDKNSPYYDIYGPEYTFDHESNKVMEESTAYIMTKMLNPNAKGSISGAANVGGLNLAIKTGTSTWGPNNNGIPEGVARDRWTVGYSPDVSTAVWTGYDYNGEANGNYYSSLPNTPLYIFKYIMSETASKGGYLHDDTFPQASNVFSKGYDGQTYYFIDGSTDVNLLSKVLGKVELNGKITGDNLVLTWKENEDNKGYVVKYKVLIDNKEYKTTKDSKELTMTIPLKDIYGSTCKDSYQVSVLPISLFGIDGEPSSVTVTGSGCESKPSDTDTDGDGVIDSEDKCPDEAGKPEFEGCTSAPASRTTTNKINWYSLILAVVKNNA